MINLIHLFVLLFLSFQCPLPLDAESSSDISHLFHEALQNSRQGNLIEALANWNNIIDHFPDNPSAWGNRGNVKLALGDLNGAIQDQSQSIKLDSKQRDAYLNRGVIEEKLQLWRQATDDYQWILTNDPLDSETLYNLANVAGALGDWEKAQNLYSKAAKVRPSFAIARSSQALATYQLGHLDIAEVELRELIKSYPLLADARAALVALLWHRNLVGEAQSHWAAVIGLDNRYNTIDWLLNIRRWPEQPTHDLIEFIQSID